MSMDIVVEMKVVDHATGATVGANSKNVIEDVNDAQIANFIEAATKFGADCHKQVQKDHKDKKK